MNYQIANSTGFRVMNNKDSVDINEAIYKALKNPVEETGRTGIVYSDKKDKRIEELIKKSVMSYTVDAMIRQAVDKYSEMFKTFDFDCGHKQIAYLKERLTKMTLQTGEHWETLLTRIVHEYFKTGNAFIVKRRGGVSTSAIRPLYKNKPYPICGLSLISAERLEVKRNKDGEFIGWGITGTKDDQNVQLVLSASVPLPNDQALIHIPRREKSVLVPGQDCVQVAYKKGADSAWGFGLTLAALEDVSMTRMLEQVVAIMMKKFSNPIIHHKITRPTSPLAGGMQQEINMAYQLYRQMAPDGVLITGGNAEIKAIGSESQALRSEGYLRYFLYRSLTGLGISPYVLGLEGSGQGTMEAAVELLMMKVRFCQAEIAREIEMFLFNEILWEGGFDPYMNAADRVHLVFEDIDENRKIKLQTHAADMFQKNLWGHEEARAQSKTRTKVVDNDLYLNKVDIPKIKAEAGAKGEAQKTAGVAIAKAKPKPAPTARPKRKAKEVLDIISNLIPENEQQLLILINLLERKYDYDPEMLVELVNPISKLLGDKEAITTLLVERLSDE